MIKSVEEVNKKVGAGAQKSGAGGAVFGPNERLVARLVADYPEIRFRVGKKFMFRPPRTVIAEAFCRLSEGCDEGFEGSGEGSDGGLGEGFEAENAWGLQLLHEVGHALSGHRGFRADVERLRMEREAWERARGLCATYNIWYDEEFVEAALDTYRDWLHQRSRCAECGLTRYQGRDGRWHCPGCEGL